MVLIAKGFPIAVGDIVRATREKKICFFVPREKEKVIKGELRNWNFQGLKTL